MPTSSEAKAPQISGASRNKGEQAVSWELPASFFVFVFDVGVHVWVSFGVVEIGD